MVNDTGTMGVQKTTLEIKEINRDQNVERNERIVSGGPPGIPNDIQKFFKRTPHFLYKQGYPGSKAGEICLQGYDGFRAVRIGQGNTPKIKTKGFPSSRGSELRSNLRQQNAVGTPRTHVVVDDLSNYRRVQRNQCMVTTPNKKFQGYHVTIQ